MRFGSVVGVLLVMAVLATSCAPPPSLAPSASAPSSEAPRRGPTRIVAAVRGDPRTMSDGINNAMSGSTSAGVREIEQLVNSGLGVMDPKGELRPQLAETLPSLDNGSWKLLPDGGMETTWKIKPEARWHDAEPLTAADFAFSVTVLQDKSLPMQQDQAFQFIDSVQSSDPRTLTVIWKSTYVDADKLFTLL